MIKNLNELFAFQCCFNLFGGCCRSGCNNNGPRCHSFETIVYPTGTGGACAPGAMGSKCATGPTGPTGATERTAKGKKRSIASGYTKRINPQDKLFILRIYVLKKKIKDFLTV